MARLPVRAARRRSREGPAGVGPSDDARVPLLDIHVNKPDRGTVAWYVGLGVMSALDVIEWPVAILAGVTHALATHTCNPHVREAAKGAQAGSIGAGARSGAPAAKHRSSR